MQGSESNQSENRPLIDVYAITHQPTQSKPNVKLNDSEGAKYQWYEGEYTATEITDINASGTWEIFDYDKDVNYGVYDKKNGWAGHDNNFFVVKLKKGQIVKGEFSQALNNINLWIATSNGAYYSEQQLMLKDNKFSFTAEIDGYYGVKGTDFMPVSMLSLYKEAASLRAFVCDTQYSAVNGETYAELKAYKPGKSYYCEVKCGDGFSTVRSDEVDFDYEITHQPTEAEPYVSVNSNNVASYQWYKDGETSAAINGENAAQFRNPVYGETYFCEVTFTDGFKVYSDILDYTYKIIHQPTEAEPYVTANNGEGAAYQWYEMQNGTIEIDDKLADARSNFDGAYASYDSEKGWSGIIYNDGTTNCDYNFFSVQLEKGQTITFIPDSSFTMIGIWSDNFDDSLYMEEGKIFYEYTAGESAVFNVWGNANAKSAYLKAYTGGYSLTKLEGQTDAAIKNPSYGKLYTCEVTFADNTTEVSNILDFSYKIIHQPTETEPYVTVNNGENASYQWYKECDPLNEITDKTAKAVTGADIGKELTDRQASYDEKNGWTGAFLMVNPVSTYYYFVTDLKVGDTVELEFSKSTSSYTFIDLETKEHYPITHTGKKGTFTAAKDMKAVLFAAGEEWGTTVKAWLKGEPIVALEGENEAKLKNIVHGNKYVCQVSFADGTKEKSDLVDYGYKITHQPTAAEPYAAINYSDGATYQWYNIETAEKTVTDENALATNPEFEGTDKSGLRSTYADGWWNPCVVDTWSFEGDRSTSNFCFVYSFKKGDKIRLELESTRDIQGLYVGKVHGTSDAIVNFDENGIGEYAISSDGNYSIEFSQKVYDGSTPVRIRATVYTNESKKIDSETGSTLKNPIPGNSYNCVITTKDGSTLTTDTFLYKYTITSQPSKNNLSVKTNDANPKAYQWYKTTGENTEIDDEIATPFDYSELIGGKSASVAPASEGAAYSLSMTIPDPASYTAEKGWMPCYMKSYDEYVMYYFIAELKKGQTINFKFSDNVAEAIVAESLTSNKFESLDVKGKEASFTASEDRQVILGVRSDRLVYVKAYIDNREYTPINGATESTYVPLENGNYTCKITFSDDTSEMSETAEFIHTCDFAGTWKTDGSKHWKECACGKTNESASHKYTNACDTSCNICSATRTITHSYKAATCTDPKTCKVCGVTSGSKLGHKYTNACDTSCNTCGATRKITHSYKAATCTDPKTCKVCGATSGSKLGHTYDNACDTTCNRCSATRTITHSYNAATCTKAKTCKVCGATSGSKLGHTYDNACDTTCNRCSAKRTITHSYNAATCTKAKTCKVCGATSGSKLGHTYTNACDTTCNRCSAKRTITHSYNAATCTKAKTCKVCGATSGSKLGHTYTNACDTSCNRCSAKRTITHTYKNVTTKATLTKNGKVENKCSVCGNVKSTTTVYYPKTIKLSKTAYTYNGKAKTPSVIVKDSKGNTLKKNIDYTVKYASGRKNTGKYSVTITFKGKYSGTKTIYFNILPSKTSKITPTCSTTEIKASWSKVTGASGYKVELLNSKGKVVKSVTTTKLTYTFKKLSKVTTYKVRVTAYKTIDKKAAYSTVSTTITTSTAPAKVTLSKVTAGSKQATVAWKTTSGASGYEVQYSTSSGFKSAKTATVKKASSKKTTIKKLTKGKKYYFKVRAYKTVDGKKIYGAWSAVKNVKVK